MIRLNSPKLNYLMIIGVCMVYLGCIVFVIPVHSPKAVSAQCMVWHVATLLGVLEDG